ncbi:hypothetical protein EYZ11_000959 [Aspergillus tanneri]|uniref:Urea amidolyase n=1 Tax=Aspergillus tanneri TaxID=1220188 RepID=A0A4V3UQQ8_9EURO|nr:hypothetical protein EYZ11_000959 [Aspergillus tanneri]
MVQQGIIPALLETAQRDNETSKAWISLADPAQICEQWDQVSALRAQGEDLPLFGVPFAAKDNIDAVEFRTTAACPSFSTEPAKSDATVVARLKAQGAILIGKTNLDQFATGLVGTRSPYGAVSNAFDPLRVSGGSSSGSAVVVSKGIVPFALGTDTAGSGRVPAGLNNVIGLKPTRGMLSTHGVVPACRSLDCVSIFALTVDDTELLLDLSAGYDSADSYSRTRDEALACKSLRELPTEPVLAICASPQWFGGTEHAAAYQKALERAGRLGWTCEEVDFTLLFNMASLLYEGPWVAERYAAIEEFIRASPAEAMDPVVRKIILQADNFTASDGFKYEYRRQALRREIEKAFGRYDALLVPTSPTFPTIQEVAKDPIVENSRLGVYTNFVNFMDWTALAIPAGWRDDGLPFGITMIAGPWEEPRLLELGHRWLSGTTRRLGATDIQHQESEHRSLSGVRDTMPLAVVGAHLSGFPLNGDLVKRGATLTSVTTTAPTYQLYALQTTFPPLKPGLKRVTEGGQRIEVEVWDMPRSEMGSFLETVRAPLGIGSIELEDGCWVHGFLCEPAGLENAKNISEFGGWRAYISDQTSSTSCSSPTLSSPPSSVGTQPITRVLVANRGEIAMRIIRTLRKMDLVSVAIYATADSCSPHVTAADIALPLEGHTVAETYLNGDQIMQLASRAEAHAVIPGYGFLAENADFAAAVEAAGLVWIGPTPEQMRALGLKHRAREIAIAAGVPVVPGSEDLVSSLDTALEEADRIGYPVMVKSTAGGGGIGLHRCDNADALREAFDGVRQLGQANFGEEGVFIEHFIKNARHIEVQVLGDGAGRVLCAGERDCSLQRRNQKVVEESPAAFVSLETRSEMRRAAASLASTVEYRNVGTVEFIFDVDTQKFYFLEMNTRLQVEHPVTEAVTGLDLVKCMVSIAMGDCEALFEKTASDLSVTGAAIEVRIYAESPLQDFRPSPGTLLDVKFPSDVRVDTWVETGIQLSSSYDPLIAKVIVHAADRPSAIKKLADALSKTAITGVETNIAYLQQIISSEIFQSGSFSTRSLDWFIYESAAVEVIEPGSLTSVQDFPGRDGLWHVGIPPSGPMDSYSFRLANRLVGNDATAAAIECSIQGPNLIFHCASIVALVGADMPLYIDGMQAESRRAILLHPGQRLEIGTATNGARAYLAVRGGIQVPLVMGSRATFACGHVGGHNGRNLRAGDLLPLVANVCDDEALFSREAPAPPLPARETRKWKVAVTPGPHSSPDYFTQSGLLDLLTSEWTVHYNSNRMGIRLNGPKPEWARSTGGEAGLHPSNIHDSPYSIGSVSFTGDEAVILTADGPSLGGFVVFAVVVEAEMWKLGQMRPGDYLQFSLISVEEAQNLTMDLEQSIQNLEPLPDNRRAGGNAKSVPSPVVKDIREAGRRILCRQAGDRALILDFGDEDGFNMRQTFHILSFINRHIDTPIPGVQELTPGVRSLHIRFESGTSLPHLLDALVSHEKSLGHIPSRLPSRTIHLPLVFDDELSRKAISRYASTIRSSAPYLPSNIDFLQELNGLDTPDQVSEPLYSGTFLVLGLGDVYLGSPCAIPLDPRHRLFGTKYNPSRSFTPRGAVGIAGQYLCIYATDSPGGYQLVGRTLPIWNEFKTSGFGEQGTQGKPWLFSLLDQITFYPVSEIELNSCIEKRTYHDLIKVIPTELDVDEYEQWLNSNSSDINAVCERRKNVLQQASFLEELLNPCDAVSLMPSEPRENTEAVLGQCVKAQLPGRCFRCAVQEGDDVQEGDALIWIESNKMEVKICSPVSGRCTRLLVQQGEIIRPTDDIAIIE